jgi:hypothetical protein
VIRILSFALCGFVLLGCDKDPVSSNNLGCGNWVMGSGSGLPHVITGFSPSSGPVGTLVSIRGLRFDPTAANNTVYFYGSAGPVQATVNSATDTNIIVNVPS